MPEWRSENSLQSQLSLHCVDLGFGTPVPRLSSKLPACLPALLAHLDSTPEVVLPQSHVLPFPLQHCR